MAGRDRRRDPRRDPARQDVPARARRHRSPHLAGQHYVVRLDRARRLHRVAFVLGRVGARRIDGDRAHRRAPRRRRGVDVPARRRRRRRRARGARPDRRLVRVGRRRRRRCSSAAAPASCRSWRCCGWRGTPATPTRPRSSCRCGRRRDLYYADELPGPDDDGRLHARGAAPASTRPPGRLTADDVDPSPARQRDGVRVRVDVVRTRSATS